MVGIAFNPTKELSSEQIYTHIHTSHPASEREKCFELKPNDCIPDFEPHIRPDNSDHTTSNMYQQDIVIAFN